MGRSLFLKTQKIDNIDFPCQRSPKMQTEREKWSFSKLVLYAKDRKAIENLLRYAYLQSDLLLVWPEMFTIGIEWKVKNNILQVTFFKPKGISILPKKRSRSEGGVEGFSRSYKT